jgi:UDPglucose--hexose-1-phosphate uridylyltransferase
VSAPEIRIDQLTGLRVVLAPGRAERPEAFSLPHAERRPDAAERCPFCEGREERTPPETWADRPGGGAPDTPGWRVRAVPNLYPVLGTEDVRAVEDGAAGDAGEGEAGGGEGGPKASPVPRVSAVPQAMIETEMAARADPLRSSTRDASTDLFTSMPAEGAHEVIINTPRHETSLGGLSEEELAVAVEGWRERMRELERDSSYVHLIVNQGPAAGASLEHTHAQIYGLRFVPAEVARERERAVAYHQRTMGAHLLADAATEEVRRRERLVAIDDEAILFCPYASRVPFELRIVPRAPAPSFAAEGQGGAAMLATALRALEGAFGELPQFNLWVRTAPRGSEEFCWHIDILPRLTIRAGFELGTGVDINTYAPERAAADLRAALG